MDFLGSKIADAKRILEQAIVRFRPSAVLVGFTGGSDSLTLLNLMIDFGIPFKPIFCNTGIGIPEQWQFIRDYCKKKQLELIEQTPVYKTYKQLVIQNGFPGPSVHTIMFSNLKEKSIRFINNQFHNDTIIVSGVRISESERRRVNINSEIQVDKVSKIRWVSPILNWDDDDKDEYLESKGIAKSPVSIQMGMSWECGCGSYAKKGELNRLKEFYPNTAKLIIDMQELVYEIGFTWGWEDIPPTGKEYNDVMEKIFPGFKEVKLLKKEKKESIKGMQSLFKPFCHKCESNYLLERQKIE